MCQPQKMRWKEDESPQTMEMDNTPNVASVIESSKNDEVEDHYMRADKMLRTDPKAYFESQGVWTGNIDFPALELVESFAEHHSDAIAKNWLILRAILYQHEDTIRKRWLKKSRKSREAILVEAFPKISKQHNPSLCQHLLGCST